MPLPKAIEAYLAELGVTGHSVRTVELETYLLRRLATGLGDIALASVDRASVTIYLSTLLKAGRKQSYVSLNAKIVKCFFRWAVETGLIQVNPLAGMKVAGVSWKPVPRFSHDECQRLVAATRTPMERVMLLLLMDCGLRASELTGLRLADINFETGEIRVLGKGVGGGKVRLVALNDAPKRALQDYLSSRPQMDGLLWPQGYDRKVLGGMLLTLGHRAKVKDCHPHRFRHSWAMSFYAGGGDVLSLKTLGGWSSWAMVERYVAAVAGEQAVAVHRAHSLV